MKQGSVDVRIADEDVPTWEDFKSVVLEKYGKLHGVLGDEVVKAYSYTLNDTKRKATRAHKQREIRGGNINIVIIREYP